MKVDVYELFPTVVMAFNLGRDLTEPEETVFKRELLSMGHNAGNWTSYADQVLSEPELETLGKEILNLAYIYFDKVFHTKNTPELYYVQSWLNATSKDEFHHAHCHANSFLSGCYYYSVEEDDRIRFHNLVEQNKMLYFVPKEEVPYNARSWWVPTKKNDVIIWRSDLHHDVPKIEKDRNFPRVSLAFNIFVRGDIGGDELRTGLRIG